ncbi:DUF222 domain-containing protein [Nocardioides albidus]|uniref:DUF222 domain-containing protein n=1 Tax=Nocardioides albidus TaxID=1517589 RepID=A0A5C4VRB1_9ACTN|nr:DUF222 domain-containing protein [Nocardioides albidus]
MGTPLITEHAAAAFGARIQTSPYGARRLIADAVDLVLRLPRLWAGVQAGTVRVPHARHVADATRDLSEQEAAWVDAEVQRGSGRAAGLGPVRGLGRGQGRRRGPRADPRPRGGRREGTLCPGLADQPTRHGHLADQG